uniref:Fibronectin type-II domain-containing protein n=1 Tax=Bos mutus grunniens TaxID=30521 RepID=A0A8B9XDW2_BOSMU
NMSTSHFSFVFLCIYRQVAKEANNVFLLSDDKCVFPFIYGNKKYFDCTLHGSLFLWCSLDADYTGRWKYCTKNDYAKCVFPFIYEGKSYDTCTIIGSTFMSYWCSLSSNYDEDGVWKYC